MPLNHQHHRRRHPKAVAENGNEGRGLIGDLLQGIGLRDSNDGRTSTVFVYYTPSATFDGPTASFVTSTPPAAAPTTDPAVDSAVQQQPTTTPTPVSTPTPVTTSAIVASTNPTSILVAPSTSKLASITPVASTKPVTAITPSSTTVPTTLAIAIASATSASKTLASSSATASATSTPDSGMSSGGKAGLAIGIILVIAAVGSLIFFFIQQKKKAAERERIEDEKPFAQSGAFAAGAHRAASTRTAKTASTAPRLSLRPITQFMSNMGGAAAPQNRGMSPNGGMLSAQSAWERPSTSASQDRNNPFGNHSEVSQNSATSPVVATGPNGALLAAGAAAGAGLARGASKRENTPQHIDLTRQPTGGLAPPSPTGTEYSENSTAPDNMMQTAGGAAIASAGGPENSAVHRVQLDFKPSMDDELELKAGQLIRMLHEYDDGWALCIRLDRSQQGVCPRTCLSTRPVKPRNGPPGPRGPSPAGAQGGYRGPQGPGPANGQNRGPGPQYNRPGSANGNRGQGPQYRPGSANSNRGQGPNGRTSPPQSSSALRPASPSAMQRQNDTVPQEQQGHRVKPSVDRKPLPGMAL